MKLLIAIGLLLASLQALYAAPELAVVSQRHYGHVNSRDVWQNKLFLLNTTTLEKKLICEDADGTSNGILYKWSPDGNWIAISVQNGKGNANLKLYDLAKQESYDAGVSFNYSDILALWAPDSKTIYAIAPSKDAGQHMTTMLVSINMADMKQTTLMPVAMPNYSIPTISLSPDGKKIVTSTDKQLVEYEVATGKMTLIENVAKLEDGVRWVGDSGDYLVKSYKSGWSLKPKELTKQSRLATYLVANGNATILHGLTDISQYAISSDGKYLAYIKANGEVLLHELATGTEKQLAPPNTKYLGYQMNDIMQFYPDGKTLAYANGDHSISIIDVATGTTVFSGETRLELINLESSNPPLFVIQGATDTEKKLVYFNPQTKKMTVVYSFADHFSPTPSGIKVITQLS